MSRFTRRSADVDLLWTLCRGFARKDAEQQLVMALEAYIDDSRDGLNRKIFVLGGLIASGEMWVGLSNDWLELLNQKPKLERLHTTEMLRTKAGTDRVLQFMRCIESYSNNSIAVGIPLDEVRSACDRFGLKFDLTWVYMLAFQKIAKELHKRYNVKEDKIKIIFSEQNEKIPILKAWIAMEERNLLPPHLLDEPRFENDRKVRPLQAADLYVWLYRRHYEETGKLMLPVLFGIPSKPRLRIKKTQWFSSGIFDSISIGNYVKSLTDLGITDVSDLK